MNKKRNIVEEIERKKIRSDYSSKSGYLTRFSKMQDLVDALLANDSNKDHELLRYLPVAGIATTETFFRYAYQEIIDAGEPYFTNAIKYLKDQPNIRFELDFLIALQGKKVSLGELFSHLLQLNNLNDIAGTLSKLLGEDFFTCLKTTRYAGSMIFTDNGKQFKKTFGTYITSVNRLFELRHIFAHEFALNIFPVKAELIKDFEHLKTFIEACEFVINKKLGNESPHFQQDMNRNAHKRYQKAQTELNKLLARIRKTDPRSIYGQIGNPRQFGQAISTWKQFREMYAKSIAASFEGGTMYPLIFWSVMCEQTNKMTDNLRQSFERVLKEVQ